MASKIRILEEGIVLSSSCAADVHLCFGICKKLFSPDVAHNVYANHRLINHWLDTHVQVLYFSILHILYFQLKIFFAFVMV